MVHNLDHRSDSMSSAFATENLNMYIYTSHVLNVSNFPFLNIQIN